MKNFIDLTNLAVPQKTINSGLVLTPGLVTGFFVVVSLWGHVAWAIVSDLARF